MHPAALALLGLAALAAALESPKYPVVCWGDNEVGQLGIGSQVANHLPIYVSADAFEAEVTQISSGDRFMVALDANGSVYTWGNNDHCQNGYNNTDTTYNTKPRKVELENKVKYISAGVSHAFAVYNATHAYVWGANESGQANPGKTGDICKPELVNFGKYIEVADPIGEIAKIIGGEESSYILTTTGSVLSWGKNTYGQLGLGATIGREGTQTPTLVTFTSTSEENKCESVSDISAGKYFVHATCNNNTKLFGWGDNMYYMANAGPSTESLYTVPSPVYMGPMEGDSWIMSLSNVNGYATHAVMLSGKSFVCWGQSDKGECGVIVKENGGLIDRPKFNQNIPKQAIKASAGDGFTVLVTDSGTVTTAGSNHANQLGNGDYDKYDFYTEDFKPITLDGLDPMPTYEPYQLASGLYHTCILYGKYEVPSNGNSTSFWDVYQWFLIADAIVSAIYFIFITVLQCLRK